MRGAAPDPFRRRRSILEPHYALLERRWTEGCHNGAQLWRELRHAGFRGGLRFVSEWATRRRLAERPGRSALSITAPPLLGVARLLTSEPSALPVKERCYLDRLLAISVPLARARERKVGDLDNWLAEAAGSELCSLANGLKQGANRGSDHPAQADQATDGRTGQA